MTKFLASLVVGGVAGHFAVYIQCLISATNIFYLLAFDLAPAIQKFPRSQVFTDG